MSIPEQIENALKHIGVIFPKKSHKLIDLARLSGGASQESWVFRVVGDNIEKRYVLRRAPAGLAEGRSEAAISLATEAALITQADARGVPVPNIVHICNEEDGLGDGFIMDFIEGETIARKILRDQAYTDARKTLTSDCGRALGAIHQIAPEALSHLSLPKTDGLAQLAQYEDIYRGFNTPRPIIELAIQILRHTPPTPIAPVLVHGDFRLGNLMVQPSGLSGVLDWELAHIGDPREDIGWICVNSWRFGHSENRVGGFGDIASLLSAYEAGGGQRFTPEDIDWWEMLGSLKWGIMCMIMYESFRTGLAPTVERAAIGRRVSETEIDLITLIEKARNHA